MTLARGASVLAALAMLATGATAQTDGWAGLYSGAVIGFGEIHNDLSHVDTGPGGGGGGPTDVDSDGALGGAAIGFNWVNGNYVFGWESDLLLGNLDGSTAMGGGGGGRHGVEIDGMFTLRGRAGVLVNPQSLIYGTFGVAGQRATLTHSGPAHPDWTQNYFGWAAGAGFEQRLPAGPRIAVEALYVDFGSESDLHTPGGAAAAGGPHRLVNDPSGAVLRLKVLFPL
jgi:outer membrane immunogenic protein